jgi:hypothetical protein
LQHQKLVESFNQFLSLFANPMTHTPGWTYLLRLLYWRHTRRINRVVYAAIAQGRKVRFVLCFLCLRGCWIEDTNCCSCHPIAVLPFQ